MYQHQLDLLRTTRDNIQKLVAGFNIDQLNYIPTGFNNNLIWNLGHVLATQQLLCYRLSGLETYLPDEFIDRYRKGTKPEQLVEQAEADFIQSKLTEFIDVTAEDFAKERFQNYKTYPTSYGVTLHSVEEALMFNNMHEAMHFGTMLALKKLVANSDV